MATATEATLRNSQRAVAAGKIACELTHWKEVGPVRSLAAAYAESGDFNSAIKNQKIALELISDKNKPAEQTRMKLYLAGTPYRDKKAQPKK